MKLRNRKTGEIVERVDLTIREKGVVFNNDETYNSLAELNAEWEDDEELNYHYCLDGEGKIIECHLPDEDYENEKAIGNYFETKEEAEKAVERLRAWKRLKDKGLSFRHWKEAQLRPHSSCIAITGNMDCDAEARKDLDLLFRRCR